MNRPAVLLAEPSYRRGEGLEGASTVWHDVEDPWSWGLVPRERFAGLEAPGDLLVNGEPDEAAELLADRVYMLEAMPEAYREIRSPIEGLDVDSLIRTLRALGEERWLQRNDVRPVWGSWLDLDVDTVGADEAGARMSDKDARAVLLRVWGRMFGESPKLAALQIAQAIARFEGGYGTLGGNNWGAVQGPHGPPCGPGLFEHAETKPDGTPIRWCFVAYPDDDAGCADFLRHLLQKRPRSGAAVRSGDIDAVAHWMFEEHYYTGFKGTPAERKAMYAKAIETNARALAQNIGEDFKAFRGGFPASTEPPKPNRTPARETPSLAFPTAIGGVVVAALVARARL